MSSATIPVVEETISEDLWPYKREKKPSSKGGRLNKKPGTKTQAKPRRGTSATGGELTKKNQPRNQSKDRRKNTGNREGVEDE
jgi:hypothetical protein